MSTQEALRLADWLEDQYDPTHNYAAAATELRRQHAEIERLRKVEDEWDRLSQDDGKAEREIERLTAERDALRKDAERYRWLRDTSVPPHNFCLSVPIEFDGVRYTPAEVDASIDADIAGQTT